MFTSTLIPPHQSTEYKPHSIFPTLLGEDLLKNSVPQQLLGQIRQHLLALSASDYETFYGDLIHRFAEFVQVLPLRQGGPLGQMLVMGLTRGLFALDFLSQRGGLKPADNIMAYALFSVALLQDLGLTTTGRHLMVCHKEGIFIQQWMPHHAMHMAACGRYYQVRYHHDTPPHLDRLLTPLYAKQVMPDKGFSWISDHPKVLVQWLSCLNQSEVQSGGMASDLSMIASRMAEHRSTGQFLSVSVHESHETADGEAFWSWLKANLANKTLSVNDTHSGIYRTADGIFLEYSKLFEHFAKVQGKPQNWRGVFQQFGVLGLAAYGGQSGLFKSYFSGVSWNKARGLTTGSGVLGTRADHQMTQALGALAAKQGMGHHAGQQRMMEGVLIPTAYLFHHQSMPEIDARVSVVTPPSSMGAVPGHYLSRTNHLEQR